MAFTMDYSDVKEAPPLLPKGDYEVIIKTAEEKKTSSGKEQISLNMVVRNDVDQKYQNRGVFFNTFKRVEPTEQDKQVQGYSFKTIMRLAKMTDIPSGKAYNNVSEMLADMVNKCVRITVDHREYNGKTYEDVKYINETKFAECKHVYKEKSDNNSAAPAAQMEPINDVSEEEIPF
ncbi:MAG: DUF669 domain-containing protein [Clostridia bacterium]|nr:DUF669 domain-containing protein [Clostridia bacterium]